jgi:ABC-type oligopeptide transport system ATPase subunit
MPEPLLEARGLRKTFVTGQGGARRVVHAVVDVDLGIEAGETHGLVGESGSGKSTTGRILLRLIEPDAGTVTFRGRDLLALKGAELRGMRRHLQLVYQDPFSSVDPRFRAREIVAEPWEVHGLYDRAERRRRAAALLARVGIGSSLGELRPGSFSGGQLQRIGIARALALEPSLIVCDEPVSALDVSVQGQILNLLLDLKQELGIAYLFISHDLAVVRHMSDRVSVMYAGRIVETGTRREVFEEATHPYTLALLAATGLAPAASEGRSAEKAAAGGSAPAGPHMVGAAHGSSSGGAAGPPGSAGGVAGPPGSAGGVAGRATDGEGADLPPPRSPHVVAGSVNGARHEADDADLTDPTVGCPYRARCPLAAAICEVERPALIDRGHGHAVACHFPVDTGA